jgi:hypothetical protein
VEAVAGEHLGRARLEAEALLAGRPFAGDHLRCAREEEEEVFLCQRRQAVAGENLRRACKEEDEHDEGEEEVSLAGEAVGGEHLRRGHEEVFLCHGVEEEPFPSACGRVVKSSAISMAIRL